MATEKQIAANRRNALFSTGPTTSEGKQASRENATKHGLTSTLTVLRSEDPAAFEQVRRDLIDCYQPLTTQEHHLVLQIASLFWRLERHERLEARMFDCEGYAYTAANDLDFEPDSFERGIAHSLLDNPDMLDRLSRYETRLRNQYLRTIRDLRSIQKDRLPIHQPTQTQPAEPAPAPIPPDTETETQTQTATATSGQNGFDSQSTNTAQIPLFSPTPQTLAGFPNHLNQ